MVPRYSRPAMTAIWAPENRLRIWFEIEALACEGMAAIGAIPEQAARTIRERGGAKVAHISQADLDRIDAIEAETRHDVIAFLTWLAEGVGPDSRFVLTNYGTSIKRNLVHKFKKNSFNLFKIMIEIEMFPVDIGNNGDGRGKL